MFDNNSKIFLFNYDVQLDKIVNAICDISFDIGKQIEEIIPVQHREKGFTIEDLFKESFLKETPIRPEALSDQKLKDGQIIKGYTKEEFFSYVAEHYNSNLFHEQEFLNALEGSDILFINKKKSNYLSYGDKSKDRLKRALKDAKILKHLISNLKSDKIQNSLRKIDIFENDILYQNAISSSKQASQPLLPFLNISFLDITLVDQEPVDKFDFWINFNLYKKHTPHISESEEYFLLLNKKSKKEIGLLINNIIIPYAHTDLIKYVTEDKKFDYYWLLIRYSYSHKPNVKLSKIDDGIMEFKNLNKDVELNQLLSFLKNNLYLSDKFVINEKFKQFFNSVVIVEKLNHLDEYEFLMSPNTDEETALGIYSTVKKGKDYNLLHWLNHKNTSKVEHFRSATPPTEKTKKLIFTLKPAICYYFLEKYFEDLIESILSNNHYDYLANNSFSKKGATLCEIDFFVKTKNKFYYIEAKTKLSKFYINEFLKRSSEMIDKFKPIIENGIEIDFILVGGYSDDNVKDYQYFINASESQEGYNVKRENLNCKPYYFTVPIPDKEGKQITCIAEPEYDKLQNLILKRCPK